MQSELTLPIFVDPVVSILVVCAVVAAVCSAQYLRFLGAPHIGQAEDDALSGLFQRDTLEAKVNETARLYPDPPIVRRRRRLVRDRWAMRRNHWAANNRRQTLEHVAAVLRRGERNGEAWDEVVKLIEGEGFIIVAPESEAAGYAPLNNRETDMPEGDIEDVMLLPAPASTHSKGSEAA